MMDDDRARHARSFGPAADAYDRLRPTYPTEAIRWAVGSEPARVVDLGAGTGILTRVLVGLGHTVLPVEPDEQMRARLAESTPGPTPLAGSAERIPVPDGAVDAVVAGQAYHWFDRERAHPEIARVLRPGGVFAPVWNLRDESVPWVARLTEIIDADRRGDEAHLLAPMDFGPAFEPPELSIFKHAVPMTEERLVGLITTRSYYLTAPPDRRAEIERQVREAARDLPDEFELPYLTAVHRAARR
jgi:SAM-dependent methyltransferase